MDLRNSFRWITTACVGAGGVLGGIYAPEMAIAQGFEQAEIEDPSQIVLATSPAGQVGYQLLIVEQLSDERPCWESSGPVIEPLLLEFDFSGICRRILDSNGYSLRMGNQDLGLAYTLRVVPKGDHLALVASSTNDYFAPSIEVGRTAPGQTDSFATIYLAPGWRLTRRSFEGQTLGHYYITNDLDVDAYMSIAVLSDDVLVAPSNYTFPATPPSPAAPPVAPTVAPEPVPNPLPQTSPLPVPSSPPPDLPPNATVVPTLTVPVQPSIITPAPTPPAIQPSVPDPVPAQPTVQPNLSTPPTTVPAPPPSVSAPPPADSPIPTVEASPTTIPPLTPTPGADVAPLLVPTPPPLSQDEVPSDDAASTTVESSPWIQFERQPSNVQTF